MIEEAWVDNPKQVLLVAGLVGDCHYRSVGPDYPRGDTRGDGAPADRRGTNRSSSSLRSVGVGRGTRILWAFYVRLNVSCCLVRHPPRGKRRRGRQNSIQVPRTSTPGQQGGRVTQRGFPPQGSSSEPPPSSSRGSEAPPSGLAAAGAPPTPTVAAITNSVTPIRVTVLHRPVVRSTFILGQSVPPRGVLV